MPATAARPLPSTDADATAKRLSISREAAALYLDSDVVDLHVDTFIWHRLGLYDLRKRHAGGPIGNRLMGQVDLPRLREAHVGGAYWSITTNPFRSARSRATTFRRNLAKLEATLRAEPDVAIVTTAAEYARAWASGRHAAFVGIQGGNAIDFAPAEVEALRGTPVTRVTLVHLSTSSYGTTSRPSRAGSTGLSPAGVGLVKSLNSQRIFVDLAHVSRAGFFDAVAAHDRSQPLLVSHTGVEGVTPHWRNLTDAQVRAVADTGGVVGIMFQSSFLGGAFLGGRASQVVDHLEHLVNVGGEQVAAIGSDFDGMILPPRDLQTCLELPRLVQLMLERKWSEARIRGVLGANFLRALAVLRP